jgi:hypothetical protein
MLIVAGTDISKESPVNRMYTFGEQEEDIQMVSLLTRVVM